MKKSPSNYTIPRIDLTVYETNEYDKFKFMKGNRSPNELHVRRLFNSFKLHYLLTIIIVNEKFEIIDGQHRFLAAKQSGIPILYMIAHNYRLEEVKTLNENSRDWNKQECLESYSELGYKHYTNMKKFMIDYPEFKLTAAECILTNTSGGVNNRASLMNGKGRVRNFQEGRFTIPDLKLAYNNADKIKMIQPYYKGWNRDLFVKVMIKMFKHSRYDHNEFIRQLNKQPTALVNCVDVDQYTYLIEEIYNKDKSSKNRTNLRWD